MPVIEPSSYRAPWWLHNGHMQTILAALRRAPAIAYERERIETPDGDVLELDWNRDGAGRLVIISYGMESDPQSPYIRSAVHALRNAGCDVLVWNFRGSGGAPNRKVHFYHGGLYQDLESVILHALARGYCDIRLAGFSLGGNMTLNYLGHRAASIPSAVRRAAVFSAPVDVADCARRLRRPANRLYVRLFLRSFRRKIRAKMAVMPGQLDDAGYDAIATIEDYDARYTVPHFGFADVEDMYRRVSSAPVLPHIRLPTLLVNAVDDPFIGAPSLPFAVARQHLFLHFESPRHGGHLGFLRARGGSWMNDRLVAFLAED